MEFISFVFTEIWEKLEGDENIPPGRLGSKGCLFPIERPGETFFCEQTARVELFLAMRSIGNKQPFKVGPIKTKRHLRNLDAK